MPPLRERTGDIPLLVDYFINEFSKGEIRRKKTIDRSAVEMLKGYHWPGNVREFKNLVERLTIMTRDSVIGPGDIPDYIRGRVEKGGDESFFVFDDLKQARDQFERIFIERKLRENEFNITATAKILNMERSHLHKKIRTYKIGPGQVVRGRRSIAPAIYPLCLSTLPPFPSHRLPIPVSSLFVTGRGWASSPSSDSSATRNEIFWPMRCSIGSR